MSSVAPATTKRKAGEVVGEEEKVCEENPSKKAKIDPMPRTSGLVEDVMITVRQRGVDWTPQAVTMKSLRTTESAFIDEAIDLETCELEIPADTCPTQLDFVELFTIELRVDVIYCSHPIAIVEAWDRLGCGRKVTKYLNDLEQKRARIRRPDPLTVYRWGRRFFRPLLVRQGLEAVLDAGETGPQPEPDMMPELLKLARRYRSTHIEIGRHIKELRDSAQATECGDECPLSCSGDSDEHPEHDWDTTNDGDYDLCVAYTVNKIAALIEA